MRYRTILAAVTWELVFSATLLWPALGLARDDRSASERHAFQREHPCPATGQRRGSCPGYVIDHIQPLCAGGADAPANMQWQQIDQAKAKDRWERSICRRPR